MSLSGYYSPRWYEHPSHGGWRKARRRMVRAYGVNILAKLWVRSERLRKLKTWFLRRKTLTKSLKYRPLPDGEVRLLVIKPGYSLSTIDCKFECVNMQNAGDYAALSYTWGIMNPSIPILVNGSVSLISENLYLALLHLRKRRVTRLWVDALCINQNDVDERSRQVNQMKDVYQNAAMVYIWLGESNELSERAFDELHGLTEYLDWDDTVPGRVFDRIMTDLDEDHRRWRAISEILYRPWFRRMWVIQEALAACRAMMVCGRDILDLDLFLKLINSMLKANVLKRIMSYHPNRHELLRGPMQIAYAQLNFLVKAKFQVTNPLRKSHKFQASLLDYLAETRWAEATNPRDKVFGILSLANDARSLHYPSKVQGKRTSWLPFKADYTLSEAQVFINAAKAILCTSESLDVLRFSRPESKRLKTLPSWVPDWSSEEQHHVLDYLSVGRADDQHEPLWRPLQKSSRKAYGWDQIYFDITQYCRPSLSLGRANALTVKGFYFDTITTLSRHTGPGESLMYHADPQAKGDLALLHLIHQHLEELHQWIEDCAADAANCSPYATGQNAWTSFWKTMNQDDTEDDTEIPKGYEAIQRDIRKAQAALGMHTKLFPSLQGRDPDSFSQIVANTVVGSFEDCMSRLPNLNRIHVSQRFTTTQKKYMGVVPSEAQVGDQICVIYGSELPFILRHCGRNRFKFIGHAKLQGFNFDDAVIESSVIPKKKGKEPKMAFDFATRDKDRQKVYVTLKKTRQFTLV